MSRAAIRFGCNKVRLISARRSVPGAQQRTRSSHSNRLSPFQRALPWLAIISTGLYWYTKRQPSTFLDECNEKVKEGLEEMGVNREFCETKIAELKQKIESGSTSKHDRYALKRYEEKLHLFTKGA